MYDHDDVTKQSLMTLWNDDRKANPLLKDRTIESNDVTFPPSQFNVVCARREPEIE